MHTYLALFPLDIYSKANVYLNCFVDSFKVFTVLEKKVTSVSTKQKMWHKIPATVLSQCRFYRGLVLRGQNSEARGGAESLGGANVCFQLDVQLKCDLCAI